MQIATDLATIKQVTNDMHASFQEVKLRFIGHIQEGERPGGIRERVLILEREVSALKKAMWFRCIVSGLIGGLVGSGAADAISLIVKILMKGV
jgi:hypothetical protein